MQTMQPQPTLSNHAMPGLHGELSGEPADERTSTWCFAIMAKTLAKGCSMVVRRPARTGKGNKTK